MPYKAKGKCVYKADTGKKVGCTKGPVKKYLAALHANVPDAKTENLTHNTNMNEAAKVPNEAATNKLVKFLAKKAEDHMLMIDLDSPEQITFYELENVIEMDVRSEKVKKIWNLMKTRQKHDLYEKVIDVLEKKYGDDGYDDDLYEDRRLGRLAKKIMENRGKPIMLNGKEVEVGSIMIAGIDTKDYPEFSEAYIESAEYVDGTPLNHDEVAQLGEEHRELVNELAFDQIQGMMGEGSNK
jgi:hypothetical protein